MQKCLVSHCRPSSHVVYTFLLNVLLPLILDFVSSREHNHCCLRGANICSCPKLTLNDLKTEPCSQQINAQHLTNNSIHTRLYGTVKPGYYTVLAIAPDETLKIQRPDLAWVVFAAVNLSESCLSSEQSPCKITPIYTPQTGDCTDPFDYDTRLFVFAIRQHREIRLSELYGEVFAGNESEFPSSPHLLDYERLYDDRMFDGAPSHANQYQLVKCDWKRKLHKFTQNMQRVHNFDQIERYFYSPSPNFEPHRNLELMYMNLPIITKLMIHWERNNCGTQREMTGGEARDSLHPKMTRCAGNELDKFLILAQQNAVVRETILDHWRIITDVWIQAWRYEMYILVWMSEIAGETTGEKKNYDLRVTRHYLLNSGSQAYWTALYRATRIVCKLQLYGDAIYNLTGKWPTYHFQ